MAKKAKVQFKGIIRGIYSEYEREELPAPSILVFEGETLEEVIGGLVLDEWIFVLRVSGKRIANPKRYLKTKHINPSLYMREEAIGA